MTIPSTPEITILPETTDTRPQPPKMPDLWIVRSFMWCDGPLFRWIPMASVAHISEERAQEAAGARVERGDRRVQVIKIEGDAPPHLAEQWRELRKAKGEAEFELMKVLSVSSFPETRDRTRDAWLKALNALAAFEQQNAIGGGA